jgi:cell division protein FtsB
MKKKWHQYATVRSAIVLTLGSIFVAGMYILHDRSQLKQDNSTLKQGNSAYAKTIESKDALIADLNQRLSQKNSELQRLETEFIPFKTIALEKYTGSEQERLKQLADEIQELKNPLKKLIASATSQVEVTVKSDEQVDTTYMDVGGYLAFVKDRQPLLITSNTQSHARQNGKGEVVYRGDFSIAPGQSVVGKPIETLQTSDLIQIRFEMIPPKSQVLRGKASVVINGDTRFEFEILPQQMANDKIIVRDVARSFPAKS